MSLVYFITHPEVKIDPLVAIEKWSLSQTGVNRMHRMLTLDWVAGIKSVYCSTEKKAVDSAAVLANHLDVEPELHEQLGENNRSATGYLPREEFESVADQFFANPAESVRGWETAVNAQSRILLVTKNILLASPANYPMAIISHGAVGTLLLCYLNGWSIDRAHDQPGSGGGNYFCFNKNTLQIMHGWRAIDAEPA